MKIFLVLITIILGFNLSASADNEFALLGGLRSSSADTSLNNASVSSRTSYQAGALVNLELLSPWALRTGLLITGRQLSVGPTNQGTVNLNFMYADVPVLALYRFTDLAGIFAGAVVGFNQGKEMTCSGSGSCGAQGVDAVVFPWQIGVNFRFASQMGADLYYEYLPGSIDKNVSNVKTVGANLIVYFE